VVYSHQIRYTHRHSAHIGATSFLVEQKYSPTFAKAIRKAMDNAGPGHVGHFDTQRPHNLSNKDAVGVVRRLRQLVRTLGKLISKRPPTVCRTLQVCGHHAPQGTVALLQNRILALSLEYTNLGFRPSCLDLVNCATFRHCCMYARISVLTNHETCLGNRTSHSMPIFFMNRWKRFHANKCTL
jgi:hypothetical protein